MQASTAFPPRKQDVRPGLGCERMSGCQRASHGARAYALRPWGTSRSRPTNVRHGVCGDCRSCAKRCSVPGSRRSPRRCSCGSGRAAAISRRTSTRRRLFMLHGFTLWDNFWYAGRYAFVNYSVLYYPLARCHRDRVALGAHGRARGRRICPPARTGVGPHRALGEPLLRAPLAGNRSWPRSSRSRSASCSRCSACWRCRPGGAGRPQR